MNDNEMTAADAYKYIAELAKTHALIWQAGGGLITIVHPDVQKEMGIWDHIQYVHGLGPFPQKTEPDSTD